MFRLAICRTPIRSLTLPEFRLRSFPGVRWDSSVVADSVQTSRRDRKPIKAERSIALLDDACEFELAESFRQGALAQVFGNDPAFGGHNQRIAEKLKRSFVFSGRRVRRIEKNELSVHVARLQPLKAAQDIHTEYFSFAA